MQQWQVPPFRGGHDIGGSSLLSPHFHCAGISPVCLHESVGLPVRSPDQRRNGLLLALGVKDRADPRQQEKTCDSRGPD